MKALTLEHISHAYGRLLAVDDVSLEVEPGEMVCLLGPSGCGKTTVLRIAAGLERLQKGRVLLDGEVAADGHVSLPPEKRSVGLVFQDYALFPHLSVTDNVLFGLSAVAAPERATRAREALRQVGMSDYAEAFPHMLSGGQQQRVALARALAPHPRIMLLDEPFSGLDTALRNEVRDEALHILKSHGAATLMVTHDPEEAMFMADRIALMKDGRFAQIGTPTELYFQPTSAFAAAFFGDINRFEAAVGGGKVATPLGDIPAEGFADGARVEVLIRPEGLQLQSDLAEGASGQAVAEVVESRLLGRSSLIHLTAAGRGAGSEAIHLHARAPGHFLPPVREKLAVSLDPKQTFVFPLQTNA
jgi:iron(III) transport system ATP-binding protein